MILKHRNATTEVIPTAKRKLVARLLHGVRHRLLRSAGFAMAIIGVCSLAAVALTGCAANADQHSRALAWQMSQEPMFKLCLLNHGLDPDQYTGCLTKAGMELSSTSFVYNSSEDAAAEARCTQQFEGENQRAIERCSLEANAAQVTTHQTTEQTCRFVPFRGQVCTSESNGVSQ